MMNRRGFLKCVALTPLAGLLKPEPHRISDADGIAWTVSNIKQSATMEGWMEKYRVTNTMATPDDLSEVDKFHRDIVVYGTGGYKVDEDGRLKHIPVHEIYSTKQPKTVLHWKSPINELYGTSPLSRIT